MDGAVSSIALSILPKKHDHYDAVFREVARSIPRLWAESERTKLLSPKQCPTWNWLHLKAHGIQLSGLNPQECSSRGARGVMQLTEKMGVEAGLDVGGDFKAFYNPAKSIRAGTLYLLTRYAYFLDVVDNQHRWFLALASYEVGAGHLLNARRLAGVAGWGDQSYFATAACLPAKVKHHAVGALEAVRQTYMIYLALMEITERSE